MKGPWGFFSGYTDEDHNHKKSFFVVLAFSFHNKPTFTSIEQLFEIQHILEALP
jgi:hypothetical protein